MSKLQKSIIATFIVATATYSGALYAASLNEVVATLESPLSAPQTDVIAGDGVFNCEGNICISYMERKTPMARDCRALARNIGKISAFKVGTKELDTNGILACNKGL
jgi:hypothetical protein